jgi:PKD domain-containing protein/type IX secretion system substrate protein
MLNTKGLYLSQQVQPFFKYHFMDKRIIFFLILLLRSGVVDAQMHDALWLFGANSAFSDPRWGTSVLDFIGDSPIAYEQERPMNLDVTVASICDSTGNLLFYTNGAWIANYTHEMMENGDSLNPGMITWQSYEGGLRVAQSHIVLPMPDHPGRYYLFHERIEDHPVLGLAVNPCYYSLIDMNANGGLGKVLEKNVVIFDEPNKTFGTMTAVKHGNGRDWWVVFPEKSKNVFYRILLTPNGVEATDILALAPAYPSLGSNAFIAFSPDGSVLARYEIQHGLYLYNFDRCTGELEDYPKFVPIPDTELGGGVAFSPNSRFLYMLSSTFVLQADLWAPDIAASLDTVAVYDGFTDPSTGGLSTTFFAMQNGPDGRIYFNTNNGTMYLHYIQYPNKKGDSCQVVQHGVKLPFFNIFTSPHFPNYRLGPLDGSPCDTLGLDNHPLAGFRWEADTLNPLLVAFTDNSFYEPMEWSWDFGDGESSAEVNPQHEYGGPGTYTVCLTVSNQYDSDTFCREVAVVATGVKEADEPYLATVFPNPASGELHLLLQVPGVVEVTFTLYDIAGRKVREWKVPGGRQMHTFPLRSLAEGMYFWMVETENRRVQAGKIIVSK